MEKIDRLHTKAKISRVKERMKMIEFRMNELGRVANQYLEEFRRLKDELDQLDCKLKGKQYSEGEDIDWSSQNPENELD